MDEYLQTHRLLWDRWTHEHEVSPFYALIDAGLQIEFLHEFPFAPRARFPFMQQGVDGWSRLPADCVQIPFLFSLQARKPI